MSNIKDLINAFEYSIRDHDLLEKQYPGSAAIAYLDSYVALLDAIRGLERDAERYRWLREQHEGHEGDDILAPNAMTYCVFAPHVEGLRGNIRSLEPIGCMPGELDAAIDAILYPGVDIDAVHRSKE